MCIAFKYSASVHHCLLSFLAGYVSIIGVSSMQLQLLLSFLSELFQMGNIVECAYMCVCVCECEYIYNPATVACGLVCHKARKKDWHMHSCLNLINLWLVWFDVVEAHCYVVDIGRTDCEQICSRIKNN